MMNRLRILLAEDEELAAEVIEEGLIDAGFEVLPACDGEAAMALFSAGARFDVLLTDLRMPRLGGLELISRLRASRPDLPVVVMTGFPPAGGSAGLHDGRAPLQLLTKPVELGLLISALRSVAGQV